MKSHKDKLCLQHLANPTQPTAQSEDQQCAECGKTSTHACTACHKVVLCARCSAVKKRKALEIGMGQAQCPLCKEHTQFRTVVRKTYVRSGNFKANERRKAPPHSSVTLLHAALLLTRKLNCDPLARLQRMYYLQDLLDMQNGEAHLVDADRLCQTWAARVEEGETASKIFQEVLFSCKVKKYPGWAQASGNTNVTRRFTLQKVFSKFGVHEVYSAIIQRYTSESVPLLLTNHFDQQQRLVDEKHIPPMNETKRIAALDCISELDEADYPRWKIFAAAYRLHPTE